MNKLKELAKKQELDTKMMKSLEEFLTLDVKDHKNHEAKKWAIQAVGAIFEKPDEVVFGMETANQALDRYQMAVETIIENNPDERLGIISHGTVMTLFIARHNEIALIPFWEELGMPAYVLLDREDFSVTEIVNDI